MAHFRRIVRSSYRAPAFIGPIAIGNEHRSSDPAEFLIKSAPELPDACIAVRASFQIDKLLQPYACTQSVILCFAGKNEK